MKRKNAFHFFCKTFQLSDFGLNSEVKQKIHIFTNYQQEAGWTWSRRHWQKQ